MEDNSLIRNLTFVALGLAVCLGAAAAQATPQLAQASRKPDMPEKLVAQNLKSAIFEQAKQELPEDWYTLYRITERIARANNLDERPWRVVVMPEYDINAFATDGNLIAIYDGILDQVAGDASAIACVIGHEMAHHTERHIAVGQAERAELIAEIEQQTQADVEAELKDARNDARGSQIGASVMNIFGIGIGGQLLQQNARARLAEADRRVEEIVASRKAELEARLLEQNRENEYDADYHGYFYMVRAGFEPGGCLRMMDVLAQTSGAEFDSTHPAVPNRMEAIETLMLESPSSSLAAEGKQNLAGTQPLTYDLSKDGGSLRINSFRGGSAADDLERLFGE